MDEIILIWLVVLSLILSILSFVWTTLLKRSIQRLHAESERLSHILRLDIDAARHRLVELKQRSDLPAKGQDAP